MKKEDLGYEGGITGLLEIDIMRGCLMERYYSREHFVFAMAVIGLTIIPTTIKSWS